MSNSLIVRVYFIITLPKDRIINFSLTYKELSENDFGFLIQIESSQVCKTGNRENLKKVKMAIIELLEGLYKVSKYSYAFADEEVDNEYTFEQISSKLSPTY